MKGYAMVYSVKVLESSDIIKKELQSKAKKIGFNLFNTYEFNKILQDRGFPIKKNITIFEFCNPAGAQQILEKLPELSVYLPCKISLYEENGVTVLSTIGLDDIISVLEVDEQFKAYLSIIFENIKQVMHSWDK